MASYECGFEVHIFVQNTFNHAFNFFSLTKVQDWFFTDITFLELLVFMHCRNMIIQLSSALATYKWHFSFTNCFDGFNFFSLTKIQNWFFTNITFLELLVFMYHRNMIIQFSSARATYKRHFSFMNCFYMHFQIAATHKSCATCDAAKRLVFFMNFPYVSIQVTFSWKQGITIWTFVRFFLIMNKIAMIF